MWKFEIYADAGEHYRWRLKSSNGQIVASSGESFDSHSNAKRAAENVKARRRSIDSRPIASSAEEFYGWKRTEL